MRRFGEPYQAGKPYRVRPGAYAILHSAGRVLLTYQDAPHAEFQLPGGGIDPGEGPLQALHREAFEETGYSLGYARHLGAHRRFVFMPDYDMWAEKVCHIFIAQVGLKYGPPSESGHSAHWMSPSQAADRLANAGDREFLVRTLF